MASVSIIVAIGKNRVIGRGNELIWPIPDDLKRFRELTTGHVVIMGQKTFDSIFKKIGKPLPNRTNIVLTLDKSWQPDGVTPAHSIEDALEKARAIEKEEIFIIGGANVYTQFLKHADKLHLTYIEAEEEGDAYFPAYEDIFTKRVSEESREWNGIKYSWIDLERE